MSHKMGLKLTPFDPVKFNMLTEMSDTETNFVGTSVDLHGSITVESDRVKILTYGR